MWPFRGAKVAVSGFQVINRQQLKKGVVMKQNVVAIELGFGTSSICTGERGTNNELLIKTYPSIVAQVDSALDYSSGLSQRDTVKVEVGKNLRFEVGPDAHLATGKTTRILNNQYIDTPEYRALFLGGLVFAGVHHIDLLVLGVPVTSIHRAADLKKMAQGSHEISGKEYVVDNVWVVVQPLGGFLSYANAVGQERYNEIRQHNVLSVDVGYGTIDSLVSRGLKINEARSGAVGAGMGVLITEIWERCLSKAYPRAERAPMDLIDEAFWKNPGKLLISGRSYPFPTCEGKDINGNSVNVVFDAKPVIESFTRSAMTSIRNSAGTGEDFGLIILFGGSAKVYQPALAEAYPDHEIVLLPNHLVAVCEGLYLGGVQYLKQLQAA